MHNIPRRLTKLEKSYQLDFIDQHFLWSKLVDRFYTYHKDLGAPDSLGIVVDDSGGFELNEHNLKAYDFYILTEPQSQIEQ